MGYHNYYHKCRQGVGRPVEIRTSRGTVHRGIIHRVTPNRVYIRPFNGGGNLGGFGYGGFNADMDGVPQMDLPLAQLHL